MTTRYRRRMEGDWKRRMGDPMPMYRLYELYRAYSKIEPLRAYQRARYHATNGAFPKLRRLPA